MRLVIWQAKESASGRERVKLPYSCLPIGGVAVPLQRELAHALAKLPKACPATAGSRHKSRGASANKALAGLAHKRDWGTVGRKGHGGGHTRGLPGAPRAVDRRLVHPI